MAEGRLGAELPAAPDDGDAFILTEVDENTDPDTAAGTYQWDEPNTKWVSKTPTSGAEFPGTPADNDLFIKTPADGTYFELVGAANPTDDGVYLFTGGAWVKQVVTINNVTALPPTVGTTPFIRLAEHDTGAAAVSGATGANTTLSLAVSFALAITNIDTTASIADVADVTVATGTVGIVAESNGRTVVTATPREMVVGGDVGIGASIAAVDRGRRRTRRPSRMERDWTSAGRVTCRSLRSEVTFPTRRPKQALDGGVSIVPAIAITISNVSRTARLGTGLLITTGGALTLAARANTAETAAHSTATGAAKLGR